VCFGVVPHTPPTPTTNPPARARARARWAGARVAGLALMDGRGAADAPSQVVEGLGDVFPDPSGQKLGDCWHHSSLGPAGTHEGMVPFHKLTQWLTYSLIEPFSEFGIKFVDNYLLTGLAEYRNGGLFVDSGVLVSRPLLPVSSLGRQNGRRVGVSLMGRCVVGAARPGGARGAARGRGRAGGGVESADRRAAGQVGGAHLGPAGRDAADDAARADFGGRDVGGGAGAGIREAPQDR
jgi:hypothetical protein